MRPWRAHHPRDGHRATTRRGFIHAIAGAAATIAGGSAADAARRGDKIVLVTLGDSILDCAHYNEHGVHPGELLVRNDDRLFPDYARRDLATCRNAALDHRARDGARIDDLIAQTRALRARDGAIALVTIGGNDLLAGLAVDTGPGIARFEQSLDDVLRALPIRPVLLGNVYDPTFGDDARNFLTVDAKLARNNLRRLNAGLARLAARYGTLVDLHAHFLRGEPSWFTRTIEPSLRGASEVRAAFLPKVLAAAGCD